MTVLGFTRPSQRLKDSVKEAEELGFQVMAAPSLDIQSGDATEFERLEANLGKDVPVIFGSATAVEECRKYFGDRMSTLFEGCRVISIGPNTTKYLAKEHIKVSAVPEDFSSFGLVDLLKDEIRGRKVVIVRSDSGTDILSDGLRDAGAELVDIASYKLTDMGMTSALMHMFIAIKRGQLDVMAFTSPMSAKSFFEQIESYYGKERAREYMDSIKVAAIGRPTAMRLESLGRKPDIVPERTTFHDMLLAIKKQC